MKEVKVYQRILSYGEIQDAKRLAEAYAKKQAKGRHGYNFVKAKDRKPGFKELSYGVTNDKVEKMLDA